MFKKILLATGMSLVALGQAHAEVKISQLRSGDVRITYTGSDIAKFDFIQTNIENSNSSIASRCFTADVVDDFGQPIPTRQCVLLLGASNSAPINSRTINRTVLPQVKSLRLTEPALVSSLRQALQNTPSKIGTLTQRQLARRCSSTNSNPSCYQSPADVSVQQGLVQVSHVDSLSGSVVCSNRVYEEKGLTGLNGCYITANAGVNSEKFVLEDLSSDIEAATRLYAILEPQASVTVRYLVWKGNPSNVDKRYDYRLGQVRVQDEQTRHPNRVQPFNPTLSSVSFFGLGIQNGDITCEQIDPENDLDPSVIIRCTNNTSERIDIGRDSINGGILRVKASNYYKGAL